MTKKNKLIDKAMTNPKSLRYSEMEALLTFFGWEKKRSSGSHTTWDKPGFDIITITNKNGMAPGYQVKQLLQREKLL